ncbi:MAG: hypothetical protein VW397_08815 [Candidatus Margulisiibacteriota bacterium]
MSGTQSNQIDEIVSLLQNQSPNFSHVADLVYHANKSLGHSYIEIRERLNDLKYPQRLLASRNFIEVIKALDSPQMFIESEK